jgi:hypothetical protein
MMGPRSPPEGLPLIQTIELGCRLSVVDHGRPSAPSWPWLHPSPKAALHGPRYTAGFSMVRYRRLGVSTLLKNRPEKAPKSGSGYPYITGPATNPTGKPFNIKGLPSSPYAPRRSRVCMGYTDGPFRSSHTASPPTLRQGAALGRSAPGGGHDLPPHRRRRPCGWSR